ETDRFLARNIVRAFKRAGHNVHWLVDLQAAVNDADTTEPQAVIMDLFLAGRSGIEFLYEFRSYPEWATVPVILFSSVPDIELEQCQSTFIQLGVTHFFYKPSTTLAELC